MVRDAWLRAGNVRDVAIHTVPSKTPHWIYRCWEPLSAEDHPDSRHLQLANRTIGANTDIEEGGPGDRNGPRRGSTSGGTELVGTLPLATHELAYDGRHLG